MYGIEILLVTPLIYCLPLFVARALFEVKMKQNEILPYLFTTGGCVFIIFWFMQNQNQIPLRSCLAIIVMIAMFSIYIKTEPKNTIYTFGIFIILYTLCEFTTFIVAINKMKDCFLYNYNQSTTLQLNLFPIVFCYIMIYTIYYIKKNNLLKSFKQYTSWHLTTATVLLILCTAVMIILEIEQFIIANSHLEKFTMLMIYLTLFIVLTIFASSLFTIQSIREKKKNEDLIQIQQAIVEIYDTTRTFRHNYKNLIITLNGYCKEEDYGNLKKMLVDLNNDLDNIYDFKYIAEVTKIKDSGLRWLIISKIAMAQRLGIIATVSLSENLNVDLLSKSETSAIIGILFDNAIEAAEHSEKKKIDCVISTSKADTIISIRNTYAKIPNVDKMFNKDFTTKDGHSGIGLYSVKKTINKYENVYVDARIESEMLCIDINILDSEFKIE